MKAETFTSLRGQVLLAMPGMGDERFTRSVILLMAHDDEGAMGFVLNQPAEGATLGDILKNLPPEVADTGLKNLPVFIGGPVQLDNGFVLHTTEYGKDENNFSAQLPAKMSRSMEILNDAARGTGPKQMRFYIGYSGWDAGQLEKELQNNVWLVSPCHSETLFTHEPQRLYGDYVARLGIDLSALSQEGGEA
ncbi:MAG: YqgE/AlgH family protein [Parvibaculales bacterium]